LRAAFRTGNGTATEAEVDAFPAWVRGVRVEGALLTLALEELALPIRLAAGGADQFRAAPEGEQPG
jgi:hypothetical protein